MYSSEDNIIILLRKIVALSVPKDFEATQDISIDILLNKLSLLKEELFLVCDSFINTYEISETINNDIKLKSVSIDNWKLKYEDINNKLFNCKETLIKECKKNHINIDYELNKLLN